MPEGDVAELTQEPEAPMTTPPEPAAEPAPPAPPMPTPAHSFLHALIEHRLHDEAVEPLCQLLGSTIARTGDEHRYGVTAFGRFHGSRAVDLLAYAQKNEMSGALVVVEHDEQRVLYLSGGRLVGATSTVLFERLGRLLYQAGSVTKEDSSTLVDAEEKQGPHALLLWVPLQHLTWAVERRVWEVGAAMHLTKRGHFIFVEGEPELQGPAVALDPSEVALEGKRRYDEMRHGTGDADASYNPPSMPPPPPQIERRLLPLDISDETLTEVLKRIQEAEGA